MASWGEVAGRFHMGLSLGLLVGCGISAFVLYEAVQAEKERKAASVPAPPPASAHDYTGRVVLVTGASSGIGAEIAIRLAARGATLALHYSANEAGARQTAAACLAAAPAGTPSPHLVRADFSPAPSSGAARDAVRVLVEDVVGACGRIDVLVNNSGVYTELDFPPAESSSDDDDGGASAMEAFQGVWDRTVSVNLTFPALLSFAVARHMAARVRATKGSEEAAAASSVGLGGNGAIVMVGSRGAFRGEPRAWAYGASKAGLHQLAQSMAVALGPHGISVTAVAPGFVETPMAAAALSGAGGARIREQSPWGRVASVGEVADCVAFLGRFWAVPWVTGTILDCNGASYLRT
jgi:3-oxoacyl-[acyl-carrier protein] reductase